MAGALLVGLTSTRGRSRRQDPSAARLGCPVTARAAVRARMLARVAVRARMLARVAVRARMLARVAARARRARGAGIFVRALPRRTGFTFAIGSGQHRTGASS